MPNTPLVNPAQTNAGAVDWDRLIPKMRVALKRVFHNEQIEVSRSIHIDEKIDVTGDGVPEALVDLGSGGAAADSFAWVAVENGQPVIPLFKQKDGKVSALIFTAGSGGAGRYGRVTEMLGSKNAITSLPSI